MKYVVLWANGDAEILKRAAPLELKELQKLVGGYIEMVRFSEKSTIMMVINEEGRR